MTFDTFLGLLNQTPAQGNRIYAQVLYAQAKLETGNFTSNLFKSANNLFGMKPSQSRTRYYDSSVTVGSETFASYASPTYSVVDRADLDAYNGVLVPVDVEHIRGYMTAVLSKGYATDPNYITKWVDVLKNIGNELGGSDDDGEFDHIQTPTKSMKYVYIFLFLVGCYLGYKWYKRRQLA